MGLSELPDTAASRYRWAFVVQDERRAASFRRVVGETTPRATAASADCGESPHSRLSLCLSPPRHVPERARCGGEGVRRPRLEERRELQRVRLCASEIAGHNMVPMSAA